jgi:methionyl aminopeptidase
MEEHELESYKKAGKIAKQVVDFAKDLIKPEMKLIDIANAVDEKIAELGAQIAFPVNLSLNEVAAHYTPAPEDETLAEGLLTVDIGVAVDGFIADTAFSLDLTEDGKFKDMLELNQKILEEISEIVKPGMKVHEVGDAAQDELERWNEENDTKFSIIKSLSGHELGENTIHAGLTISNYRNDNEVELEDTAVAIEPFVTTGAGDVYEGQPGGIYALQSDENVRDRDAREVLKFIKEKFVTRPFCLRQLVGESELSLAKLKFILKSMVKQGILKEYAMLIEKSKAPVSQFEHTFVIGDEVVRTTG